MLDSKEHHTPDEGTALMLPAICRSCGTVSQISPYAPRFLLVTENIKEDLRSAIDQQSRSSTLRTRSPHCDAYEKLDLDETSELRPSTGVLSMIR